MSDDATVIPRLFLDSFLSKQGLGGLSELPTKMALFIGADAIPPAARALAEAIAAGHPITMGIECGPAVLRFVVK
jgi:hypothetical protein